MPQTTLHTLKERSNYRQEYDAALVASIAASIAESSFKEEYPITVYLEDGNYIIIDGHTRYNAALLASVYDIKTHKPMLVVWIVVKDKPTDSEFILDQLAANENRRDPDDISKGIGYQRALDEIAKDNPSWSTDKGLLLLASKIGHTVDYVERRVLLLKLTSDIQELVARKALPIMYASAVTVLDSNRQRIAVRARTHLHIWIRQLQRRCRQQLSSLDCFRDRQARNPSSSGRGLAFF